MDEELLEEIAHAAAILVAKLAEKRIETSPGMAPLRISYDHAVRLTEAALPAIAKAIIETPRYAVVP